MIQVAFVLIPVEEALYWWKIFLLVNRGRDGDERQHLANAEMQIVQIDLIGLLLYNLCPLQTNGFGNCILDGRRGETFERLEERRSKPK